MSHIPSHAMPHAKPHDETPHDEAPHEPQPDQVAAPSPAPTPDQGQPAPHPDLPTPVAVQPRREASPPWTALAIGGALVAGGALIAVLAGRRAADPKPDRKQGRRRKAKRSADQD